MKTLIALLRRELLEHKSVWRVAAILIGIAVLVKLSLSLGNLSVNIDLPSHFQLDNAVDGVLNTVVGRALNVMNFIIMWVLFIVAFFYALACLFNERQDQSVLFWRSLPISDSLTVACKLLTALVVVPLLIIVTQIIVAAIFFGTNSGHYLSFYFSTSLAYMMKLILWSILPVVSWCLFCSAVAKNNPFLLAIVAPILVIIVDKLFFAGVVSQLFIINRLTNTGDFAMTPLIAGLIFSAACIALAIAKRSQRI